MANKILVVDDEKLIVKGIKFSLEQDGMEIHTAYDGEEALNLISQNKYDLIVLDVMLPKKDGFEVCQTIRMTSDIPVIMLTAKDGDMDKILGLEYGADDYLTKPFNILELKARIKAILRRSTQFKQDKKEEGNAIKIRGLKINLDMKQVEVEDKLVNLTSTEFELLELFMKNPKKVYSREDLLSIIWGNQNIADTRTVDVHVRRLREKIESKPSSPQYIQTKWGVGYYIV